MSLVKRLLVCRDCDETYTITLFQVAPDAEVPANVINKEKYPNTCPHCEKNAKRRRVKSRKL